MKEITVFGRGGQGTVVAAEILAEAYFHEGFYTQSFPSFGVERRGAPVTAFLRVDKEFIYLRSMIYKAHTGLILSPDVVNSPTFKPSLVGNATLVINSGRRLPEIPEYKCHYVDATGIALELGLGSKAQPLVNTAMLGAFARVCGDLSLENVLKAVENKVPLNVEKNVSAVKKAYKTVARIE
ncbi:MAG: 2-oxoacid:acceptor oxidoreductase family protein [Candidatus Zixiibacteriota bacterium]|nr:MAG: 2-oxoacid:acceptor oxidoreductase family protein [candidate division Zixibacteria bacterium]